MWMVWQQFSLKRCVVLTAATITPRQSKDRRGDVLDREETKAFRTGNRVVFIIFQVRADEMLRLSRRNISRWPSEACVDFCYSFSAKASDRAYRNKAVRRSLVLLTNAGERTSRHTLTCQNIISKPSANVNKRSTQQSTRTAVLPHSQNPNSLPGETITLYLLDNLYTSALGCICCWYVVWSAVLEQFICRKRKIVDDAKNKLTCWNFTHGQVRHKLLITIILYVNYFFGIRGAQTMEDYLLQMIKNWLL